MYLQKVTHLFGRTRALENQIDEFLDKVSESGMLFTRAVRMYLEQGPCDEFEEFLTQVADIRVDSDFYRISRRNQERCLTVELKHRHLRAPELLAAVTGWAVDARELSRDVEKELSRLETLLVELAFNRRAYRERGAP